MEDKVFKHAVTAIIITKIVAVSLMLWVAFLPEIVAEPQPERPRLPVAKDLVNIPAYIRFQADLNGVDPDAAVRIAQCESNFDPFAFNETSGAIGLYQFLPKTWKWIGSPGSATSYADSVDAFMTWYPANKTWWECK